MAIKVSESEIKKIRELGMARSLREVAEGRATPAFAEAVRRFYPKASYGPKSKAAAEAADKPTPAPSPAPSPVAKSSSPSAAPATQSISNLGPAINRRLSSGSKSVIRKDPYVSRRNNLAGRKQGKGVVDSIMERHRSLETKFKKTNPKFKRAIGKFLTGGGEEGKEKRKKAAQRPRSGKRY